MAVQQSPTGAPVAVAQPTTHRPRGAPDVPPRMPLVLAPWLEAQAINVGRHAAALRPFGSTEFGNAAAAPTEGHIQAVNRLITQLRTGLLRHVREVDDAVEIAMGDPRTPRLQAVVKSKEHVHRWVLAIERVWDFYFELFGQRQSEFADWLLSCDRIALDCYQKAYTGIAVPRSIPAPAPFAYMRTGFSPATFRRGIPLRRLGQQLNPFPLIQLPYHRLVNPWTLGAMLHEVSHNFQNDLGLARVIPRNIALRLLRTGHPRGVAAQWTRWNREVFADVSGLLLGGPGFVGSLMDVIGRSPEAVLAFSPRSAHPTPYLRTLLNLELLRRLGFTDEAEQYRRAWMRIYPDPRAGTIPAAVLDTFPTVSRLVIDEMAFRRYPALGNKSMAEVIRFAPKDQLMIEEAARRLAAGTDPGIIPERFLIGAARFSLDHRLAQPETITQNFYRALARR
jgi:hypothetical protein